VLETTRLNRHGAGLMDCSPDLLPRHGVGRMKP